MRTMTIAQIKEVVDISNQTLTTGKTNKSVWSIDDYVNVTITDTNYEIRSYILDLTINVNRLGSIKPIDIAELIAKIIDIVEARKDEVRD